MRRSEEMKQKYRLQLHYIDIQCSTEVVLTSADSRLNKTLAVNN